MRAAMQVRSASGATAAPRACAAAAPIGRAPHPARRTDRSSAAATSPAGRSTLGPWRGAATASALSGAQRRRSVVAAATGGGGYDFAIETLPTWLLREEMAGRVPFDLVQVVSSIAVACKQISALVARAPLAKLTGVAGGSNASGDEQKKLDVIANDIFTGAVANCGRTGITVSEEEEAPIAVDVVAGGNYIVAFDPIDGSSNLDACISSGSIFGIYTPGECVINDDDSADEVLEKCVTNVRKAGTELVAAGYCLYSSATVLVLTLGDGVFSFTLDRGLGEFVLTDRSAAVWLQ
ncbi:fructose-1,6-bisphosphatase I [Monoraphidium neglectum]|uniref:fructose-bisphosphatase n=1 Tax=Monoraphidium neglectum TaxID=145388 RepID=A0A0D2J7F1_9CHLO|nr:fructose-1,6-bisphosphatase I [Monoraphidium neglectum]KIY95692.1 fructose-1,6-bisphosphatase I [Monoraphidium neglectum]|eukprot:XP_013894712.1 fructose-1,6-bisphosphatase I [Monoraphidium neglectum]